ncbi:dipeptide/oligopeptide/nickel ABC transporter permease/ATP-binding protein [Agromyces atrinae]|uniref:dipeptide/oligopeptide/nickel ABC transporter permease/ATP-binding protein n=1 Tax=Agromyces atrinae TaxID=592376 RepID=UPI001F59C955|nr:dipeptide/oligopeptide/nickel ABC transporter permease/ATP-binding protein [Agromyces atrinae]MCI2957975.1 dipeptide/oligopeptide/nickel ABC transporter permease/ATP-binding protein [Agromyces atrinae]
MTESLTPPIDAPPTAVPAKGRDALWRRVLKNPMALGALIVLGLVILSAIIGPLLSPWDPNRADVEAVLAPPFGEHLLGADGSGRDVLARLLYGGRTSLIGAAIALIVALAIGIPTGLVAGYYQGWFDTVSNWFANLLMAMPGLIVLLAAISVMGPGIMSLMAIFGVLLSPGVYRLTRSGVLSVRNELYIDAARVSGLTDARILARHVLGVVRAPLVIQGSMMAGIAIVLQAGLEFLGVGDSRTASWGQMLNDAFINIYVSPLAFLWPGLIIGVTVGALAVFGAALRDVVQGSEGKPRRRSRTVTAPTSESTTAIAVADDPLTDAVATASSDSLLVVDGLRVGYPLPGGGEKIVVDGVSLHVERGEVLGLVGESGSGKSQTAFSILGLLPEGGEVVGGRITFAGETLAGADSGGRDRARRIRTIEKLRGSRIGYIPQEPMSNLDPTFTLGFQLVEPMRRILGLSKADAKKRALALLDRVGIVDPARTFDAYPHEVSGGMAQRVLIAGAVACDPELLIADEPTTALDVTVQAEVLDLLRSLQQERRMGVILVTHNFGVVADICDRVAVMQTGRIVEQNTAERLFDAPRHPYTQALLGATLEDAEPRSGLVARHDTPATSERTEA